MNANENLSRADDVKRLNVENFLKCPACFYLQLVVLSQCPDVDKSLFRIEIARG